MSEVAKVEIKSAWLSKINWTQAVAAAASIAVIFGVDVPPEQQVTIVAAIQIIQTLTTIVIKTWLTPTITPA
ncbi:MAG TPA: hypothetical protein VEO53_07275, partial [Candidatus Binatia bacterium]|nr:hypothetical protein [Candidatus Binatia bacterium]